eukprot:1003273-Heterocapsa_arctica.AAC.1
MSIDAVGSEGERFERGAEEDGRYGGRAGSQRDEEALGRSTMRSGARMLPPQTGDNPIVVGICLSN